MGSPGEATFPPTDDDGSSSVLCSRPLAVLRPTNLGSLRLTTIAQLYCAKKFTKKFLLCYCIFFNTLFIRRNYYELDIHLYNFFYARMGYLFCNIRKKQFRRRAHVPHLRERFGDSNSIHLRDLSACKYNVSKMFSLIICAYSACRIFRSVTRHVGGSVLRIMPPYGDTTPT